LPYEAPGPATSMRSRRPGLPPALTAASGRAGHPVRSPAGGVAPPWCQRARGLPGTVALLTRPGTPRCEPGPGRSRPPRSAVGRIERLLGVLHPGLGIVKRLLRRGHCAAASLRRSSACFLMASRRARGLAHHETIMARDAMTRPDTLAVARTLVLAYPHDQPRSRSTPLCPDRGGRGQARPGLAAHRRRGGRGGGRTDRGRGRAGRPAGRTCGHRARFRCGQTGRREVPADRRIVHRRRRGPGADRTLDHGRQGPGRRRGGDPLHRAPPGRVTAPSRRSR